MGLFEGRSGVAQLSFQCFAHGRGVRRRLAGLRLQDRELRCCRGPLGRLALVRLAPGARRRFDRPFERGPGVRLLQGSSFLRLVERGRRGDQFLLQRVTLAGDLRQVGRRLGMLRGAPFRIGGTLRLVVRTGLLEAGAQRFDLLFRRGPRRRRGGKPGLELGLAAAEVGGGGNPLGLAGVPGLRQRRPRDVQLFDERVARPRGVCEAGRELGVTPGETFDGGAGFSCTLLLGLAQCCLELQQPFLQNRAYFRGSCR